MTAPAVVTFIWDRLPFDQVSESAAPCLAEDWFVADALAANCPFRWRGRDGEQSHRLLFRYARAEAHKRGEFGTQPWWFFLEQMLGLAALVTVVLSITGMTGIKTPAQ